MEWDAYYKKFDEWATSTQISRLSALTSYGPSNEVAEVAQGLMDETAASRLIRRALAAGVQFTAEEICELVNYCNAAVMNALLKIRPAPSRASSLRISGALSTMRCWSRPRAGAA